MNDIKPQLIWLMLENPDRKTTNISRLETMNVEKWLKHPDFENQDNQAHCVWSSHPCYLLIPADLMVLWGCQANSEIPSGQLCLMLGDGMIQSSINIPILCHYANSCSILRVLLGLREWEFLIHFIIMKMIIQQQPIQQPIQQPSIKRTSKGCVHPKSVAYGWGQALGEMDWNGGFPK